MSILGLASPRIFDETEKHFRRRGRYFYWPHIFLEKDGGKEVFLPFQCCALFGDASAFRYYFIIFALISASARRGGRFISARYLIVFAAYRILACQISLDKRCDDAQASLSRRIIMRIIFSSIFATMTTDISLNADVAFSMPVLLATFQ